MITAILPILSEVFSKAASKFFPNPEDELKRQELQNHLQIAILEQSAKLELAAADIVKTEAASSHWLAANWRPITALIFVALIVARWFGWAAKGMTESEYISVYELIKIMIGGYVASRGLEKLVPSIGDIISNKNR